MVAILDACPNNFNYFWSTSHPAIFELQVTLMLLTKIEVNWPFTSGEAKNKF